MCTQNLHIKHASFFKAGQIILLSLSMVCMLVWGCSSTSPAHLATYANLSRQSVKPTTMPEYRLGFGDVIEVKFFNNERFNETITVRPDGRITMEKIGDIFVNGMTPSQLDSLITVTYADIIRTPDVTVFIRSFGSYEAYILGQVNAPGGYPVERNFTLVQALAAAGGTTNGANLSSIMILRQDQDNDVSALKIDITDYLKGEPLEVHIKDKHVTLPLDDFFLQPHDIVYVPRTWIASTSEFLTQVYAGLIPPIDTYLRALLWSRR